MGRSKSPRVAQSRRVVAKSRREVAKSRRTPKTKKETDKNKKKTLMSTIFCLSLKGLQTYKLKWQPQKSPPTNQSRLTNYEAEILAARSF